MGDTLVIFPSMSLAIGQCRERKRLIGLGEWGGGGGGGGVSTWLLVNTSRGPIFLAIKGTIESSAISDETVSAAVFLGYLPGNTSPSETVWPAFPTRSPRNGQSAADKY